ncbi:MAG: DUF547 domain-containing protein [Candidatus Thiodiazotropha sp.]
MIRLVAALGLFLLFGVANAFDHTHAAWDALLKRNVVLVSSGSASRLNYAGMRAKRERLEAYLKQLSSVELDDYAVWDRAQQLAFLINAYNAFTIELILTEYPDITSIKDLGGLFRSAWKRRFFTLLGARHHLDDLEHGLIREPGVFEEPRIHFAVNCASIGCPMLRNEAYVADRLEQQLEDAAERFLSDRERNRFDEANGILWVSKIFDWYEEDFTDAEGATHGLKQFLANHAHQLADSSKARQRIRQGDFEIDYPEYNWRLNDTSIATNGRTRR